MIEILDNESKAKRVAFCFLWNPAVSLLHVWWNVCFMLGNFTKTQFSKISSAFFILFFCYPSFNHLCLNLLVCFYELMNRWYWILLEVSSVFSLPYSFVVVPLEKKLIFVKVFRWKLFVTTVCINLKSIILK